MGPCRLSFQLGRRRRGGRTDIAVKGGVVIDDADVRFAMCSSRAMGGMEKGREEIVDVTGQKRQPAPPLLVEWRLLGFLLSVGLPSAWLASGTQIHQ